MLTTSSWVRDAAVITHRALIPLNRRSERSCIPLNSSKLKTLFFLVYPPQAKLQPYLFLFNSSLCFNPTSTFLELPLASLFYFTTCIFAKVQALPLSQSFRCISASFWGPSKKSFSFLYNTFLRSVLTHASYGFCFSGLLTSSSWNAFTKRLVAPSPTSPRPPYFSSPL